MRAASIRLADIADCSQHVPVIAQWMWDSWDRDRGWTLEQSITECRSWCRRDGVPLAVIALAGAEPVGCMSLIPQDLDDRPDLGPWLACQYVAPGCRGGRIARSMAIYLEQQAQRLGIAKLYMWTEHNPDVYLGFGWRRLFDTRVWDRLDVTVFTKELPQLCSNPL